MFFSSCPGYTDSMNILVVEDETRLADNIARALELESYNASVASNGLEAETMLREGSYDLVIMDIMMPNQDGLETLRHIRERGDDVRVLMLTAMSQTEDRVYGLEQGADDYLAKPFELDELLARVKAQLRRKQDTIAEVLTCDSLVLNRSTKQVMRGVGDVSLSATEFRLLEYLMLHKDEVCSETDLLEHVWDQNYDGMSNVVAVYVGYLRNKIDKAFPRQKPLIETVRGLGYRVS